MRIASAANSGMDGPAAPRRRPRTVPSARATAAVIRGRLAKVNPPSDGSLELLATQPVLPREPVQRWRLVLARDALAPEAAGRELQAAWDRALAGCGLPVAGLEAAVPRARFALAAPLGTALTGEAELLDTWLVERVPAWRVREALPPCVPAGWRLLEAYDVWLGEAALPGRVAASVYRAELPADVGLSVDALARAGDALMDADALRRERRKGEATVSYDLRPFLEWIEASPAPDGGLHLRMALRHDPERGVGRPDETLAALGERVGTELVPRRVVRERLVLADARPPAAPAPRRRPGGATRPPRPR